MRPTLLILFMFLVSASWGQAPATRHAPDYEHIKRQTNDKGSAHYYPKLFDRYEEGDTTLTDKEYQMLYYGYFFNRKYKAYNTPDGYRDSLRNIMKKHVWSEDDKQGCIKYSRELLRGSPFDLQYLSYLYGGYKELGDNLDAIRSYKKGRMIIRTILSTGDGLTNKTAYHVVAVPDEYTILDVLGYEFGGSQSLTSDQCDYLTIKENKDKIEGVYFDVKQIFKSTYIDMIGDDMPTLPTDKKKKK